MGIPTQRHLKFDVDDLPNGYEEKTEGMVEEEDVVWSTSEAKFMSVSKFPFVLGYPVTDFWGVGTKSNGNV